MKKGFILFLIVFVGIWLISASGGKVQNGKTQDFSVKAKAAQSMSTVRPDLNFGKIPLYFITNKGQVNKKAKFYARASRYTLWMTKEGLVFDSFKRDKRSEVRGRGNLSHSPYSPTHPLTKYERDVSRISFIDANKNPEMVPVGESELKVNYFIGNDKSKWHCDIPTSLAVLYKSLYKNIDLKVYGIEKEIEYDWIVKPGGDYQDIRFAYKGVKGTRLDEEGNLLIETDFGEVMHKKPVSFQEVCMEHGGPGGPPIEGSMEGTGDRVEVEVKFKKIKKNTYGFEVGEYDRSRELIIDPVVLAYSTYLGGASNEAGHGIAVDAGGSTYVTGETTSSDFPTLNHYQADLRGDTDVFITKLDTTKNGASSLIYSTYLGGDSQESSFGIAVDIDGCAYVTGLTWSSDFPILNEYPIYPERPDAFIIKLDTTKTGASSLIFSTYLGGSDNDYGYGIAVDPSGCIYVTGETWSTDFPTLNQYQAFQGGWDAFITRLVLCTETPSIELDRSSLYFGAVNGGVQTASQTFSVGISGGCSLDLDWTASCEGAWIKINPTNGTGSALVTVSIDTSGLAAGTYTGTVSIICASASNSPQNVMVNLTIHDSASTSVPFGNFSTPLDASVARGSIPVTGWVLDDIQVESVKIYRDGSIYVGDAVFIGGARPDVEASFPTYPFNYRAGWGYMLLTNFFPNSGNGTYTLSAAATDVEGNTVTLGTKTIICDNANAVKPFGAIDTPAQGGTASGSGYINYGWVLTPMPNAIPTDGSTIHIYVDGVDLGNLTYNIYRADIASLFPGYANSNGAVGSFSLDTTAYTDGIHTIFWTAEDDAGNIDGIGSRYFNIQNSSSSARVFNAHVQRLLSNVEPEQHPIDYSDPVIVKKGFGQNIEPQKIYPDDNGIITIETRELERVVIHLCGYNTDGKRHVPPTDSYIYLNTGGRLRPLPIGSTFDAKRDIFYWQPGPGFIGEYNFVFLKKRVAHATQESEWQKKIIRVIINPALQEY